MISCRCNFCGKNLKVKEELTGKRVKCPGCGRTVPVEQAAAAPASQLLSFHPPPFSPHDYFRLGR
jgi:hypothetical protein